LENGDLVFSWSGTLAVRLWDRGPALLNQHLFKVVERHGVDRKWLSYALDHAIDELSRKTHGTTMRHVTKATLLPHTLLLPPLDEQRRIVDLIASVDAEMHAAEAVAARMRDVRSGLLGDLLSGNHEIPASYDEVMG
jgi:type I restriction enzyme S subunit